MILRGLFQSCMILFVFIGNIGINVFIHSCDENGSFTSIIVKVDDHCDNNIKREKACCNGNEVKDDCCKDEVKIYHLKFEYSQSYDLHVPILAVTCNKPCFIFGGVNLTKSDQKGYTTRPPPKKPNGQKLLILNQVFRI